MHSFQIKTNQTYTQPSQVSQSMTGARPLEHQGLTPRIGLSPCLYVHHDAMDMLGRRCTTMSCQYKVKLGLTLVKGTLVLLGATLLVTGNLADITTTYCAFLRRAKRKT
jgi:hypothetical protein